MKQNKANKATSALTEAHDRDVLKRLDFVSFAKPSDSAPDRIGLSIDGKWVTEDPTDMFNHLANRIAFGSREEAIRFALDNFDFDAIRISTGFLYFDNGEGEEEHIQVEVHRDRDGNETLINRKFDIEIELNNQFSCGGPTVKKVGAISYREF